ncbi:MAG: hypothetical protein DMG41_16445 [Acidobacteria bacterium]|nr:MAG: hypothetical protein DMG41_16445 [Acidobacteriota bacterium]
MRTGADQFSPQGPAFAGSVLPSTEWRRKLGCAYCAYDDTATFASPRFMADRDLDQHAETRKARTERSRILASPNLYI